MANRRSSFFTCHAFKLPVPSHDVPYAPVELTETVYEPDASAAVFGQLINMITPIAERIRASFKTEYE